MEAIKVNIEIGISERAEQLVTLILSAVSSKGDIGITDNTQGITVNGNISSKEVSKEVIESETEEVKNQKEVLDDSPTIADARAEMKKLYGMSAAGQIRAKDILALHKVSRLPDLDPKEYKTIISEFKQAEEEIA